MHEEEVEVEQVLPEELETMLEEPAPRGRLQRLLQRIFGGRGSGIQKILWRWNERLDEILSGRAKGLREAAVDPQAISKTFAARIWRTATREGALRQSQSLDKSEDFSQLLQPLSSAEVLMLQKEIEADATVFSRIEVVRETALLQQRKSFLIAMIVGILFLLLAGPAYITETIYGSGLPSWVPLSQEVRDWFSALFFALGILLPLFAIFQIAEAVRVLLLYREGGDEEIRGAWAVPLLLSILALLFLLFGGIIPALLLLLFAYFWLSAERNRRTDDL